MVALRKALPWIANRKFSSERFSDEAETPEQLTERFKRTFGEAASRTAVNHLFGEDSSLVGAFRLPAHSHLLYAFMHKALRDNDSLSRGALAKFFQIVREQKKLYPDDILTPTPLYAEAVKEAVERAVSAVRQSLPDAEVAEYDI